MRKALLIVAMLLLVTPVMAATTITAVQEDQFTASDGNKVQTIRIDYATDVNIRAFALDINIDCNGNVPNFQGIRDFKTGESTAASPGYGIFPSRFRDFIVVTGPNWVDTNYNPTTAWNEPETLDHNSGMGFPKMIVELGTLYDGDANKPALTGTLFRFDVNAWGVTGTFNLTIAANALRGGVVNQDGNSITATFVGTSIVFQGGIAVPNVVTMTRTDANAAITGAGLVVGTTPGVYSDTVAAGIVMTQDPIAGTPVPEGSDVNYTSSLGKIPAPAQLLYPKYDPDSNLPIYWSQVAGATSYELDRSLNGGAYTNVYTGAATFKAESVAVGFYRYRVRAKNAVSTSLYNTGTYDCNAYLSTCYRGGNTADANWANWKLVGRPDCWCKASTAQEPNGSGYQCDGDADGTTEVTGVNYRVYTKDVAMVGANWKKKAADVTNDPNTVMAGKLKITGACADLDHKPEVTGVNYRVYTKDIAIVGANWKKKSSSTAVGTQYLPGNCPR